MQIDKLYFTLPEILDRWAITESDLIYLAENDQLRLSVRVFGVPIEMGDQEIAGDGTPFSIPWHQSPYSGLLDLHAQDVFQLFRCGEMQVRDFRAPDAAYASVMEHADSVFIMIGDLLMRREERDRFEVQKEFRASEEVNEDNAFIASANYHDIRCNGIQFRLGAIQAEVIRVLHEAAQKDDPCQSGKRALEIAGSRSMKMSDVFKSQAEWRQLIRSNRRGGYRLNVERTKIP